MSDSLRPHEPQHAKPPCPSPTPGVHPNLRMLLNTLPRTYPNRELSGPKSGSAEVRKLWCGACRLPKVQENILVLELLRINLSKSSQGMMLVCELWKQSLTLHLSVPMDCKPFEAGPSLPFLCQRWWLVSFSLALGET